MIPILEFKEEKRAKTALSPSDSGKLECDIWLSLNGVEPTNPTKWNDTLRMEAGKAIELQMIKVLKLNGVIAEDYDQDKLATTEVEREGIKIRMRFDAQCKQSILKVQDSIMPNTSEIIINEGEPLEVKSVNNKNSFDIQDYIDGKPRESYVMQLAMYCDALNKDRGHLFVSTIDGLNFFWFEIKKISEGKYKCGEVEVDITAEYKRFASIYKKFVDKVEPNWTEELYKLPLAEIDWTKLSVSKIGEARNNRKVIGTEGQYKILYSNYTDLILSKQGITKRGYSEEELALIKEKTAGYSSKKKTND